MKKSAIVFLVLGLICHQLYSQCPVPSLLFGGAPTPTTLNILCVNNGGTTVLFYVEYGATGFTPGTAAAPGTGGILFTTSSGTGQTITGLTPGSEYDFYIRQTCTGGVFSANSAVQKRSTPPDCSTAPVVSCGVMQSVSFPATNYWGVWAGCSSNDLLGREKIYQFIPSFSGSHILFATPPASALNVYYSYKTLAAGCTSTGWTCIGSRDNFNITQLSFGPLTAGTTYIIMVSPNNSSSATTADFRIECPNCTYHTVTSDITDRTPTTVTLHSNQSGGYVEYGPAGFIPGSGASPGTNGILVPINPADKIVTGLTPATSYDFYVRSFCTGAGWSANSMRVNNATTQCPQIINYGSLNSTSVFNVNSIHGFFGNYNVCSGLNIGYGDEAIVKFTAPAAAVYDVLINDNVTSTITSASSFINFGSRVINNTCGPTGFVCQIPYNIVSNTHYYSLSTNAGVVYDMLLDVVDSFCTGSASVIINCATAKNITTSNVTSTSATINFSSSNVTYVEYGPVGFNPGTGSVAGGGTLLPNATSPVSLTSLSSFTNYVAYIRTKCGNDFSANQQVTFKTLHNCGNEPLLTCGTNFNVNMFDNTGQWTGYNCGTGSTNSTEFLYRFTPTQTGLYTITNIQSIGFGSTSLNIYYKTAGGSCDVNGWTCVGTLSSSPQTINLATLIAGTTYLILFDGLYTNCTKTLRIDCLASCTATITPSGSQNFCSGPGITLQANTGTGLTYQWRKNSVNIAGATNSSYLANSNGTFSVVVTNAALCSATSAGVSVTTPPSVTITPSGATHFCTGGSVTLSATSGQTVTYKWKKNGAYISGATNSTYVATASGSYNCVVTNSFGCSKGGTAIAITGPPSAVITANGPTTFCAGGSVQLSAQSGYIYQWIKNSANIAGATLQNYTTTNAGNYKVKVTDGFGCSKTTPNSNQITVSVPCRLGNYTFENDLSEQDVSIKVFPNPSDGKLKLEIGNWADLEIKIKVFDVLGKIVFAEHYLNSEKENVHEMDLSRLERGIYFLKLSTADDKKTIKVMKK